MRRAAFVLALLAVLALPAGSTVAAVSASETGESVGVPDSAVESMSSAGSFAQQTQSPGEWTAETRIQVSLEADRDARWRVITSYSLDTKNETEVFREYADAFEAGEHAGAVSVSLFRKIANASSEAAGRSMTIRNVSRTARVEDGTGTLVLSFTWTNFLGTASESDLLVLRDAFLLPGGGTWLSTLQPDQQLVIQTPPGYAINYTSVPVRQRSNAVIISGPRDFSGDEPLTIKYQPTPATEELPWEFIVGGLVALVVIAIVAVRRRGELGGEGAGPLPGGGAGSGPESGGEPTAEGEGAGPVQTGPGPAEEADQPETIEEAEKTEAAAVPETPEEAAEADEEEEEVDLSLLSDEERVEYLLEQSGGRMRQAKIVEETGWSDAKVSQLLSSMADEGRIEKLRIGRENLISLPETDLTNGSEDDTGDADENDAHDAGDTDPDEQ